MAGKRLGQHFLHDREILERIIRASGISDRDTVVEIGPGHGHMTEMLARKARRVIAIELDGRLCEIVRERLKPYPNAEVVPGDALRYPFGELGPFSVVANIPYYITTPVIFRLLESRDSLRSMTLTVQREVAERMAAVPGGKNYGVLSLAVQYHADVSLLFVVGKEFFRPPPKVDSAVVKMDITNDRLLDQEREALFFRVVRMAFSGRRKTLGNTLMGLLKDSRGLLTEIGIDPSRRAETLTMTEFVKIADRVAEIHKPPL